MAQFKLDIPQEARESVQQTTIEIVGKQAVKDLPGYAEFVQKLMKSLPTPAEELHHATTGIAGEAGELLDLSKKVWIYNKPLDLAHLIEEMGDLCFYFHALMNMTGFTLQDIQAANMKKLMVRYSEGVYSDKQANERADKAATPAPAPTEPGAGRKFFTGEGVHGQNMCQWPGVPACVTVIGSQKKYCAVHQELMNTVPSSDAAGPGKYVDRPPLDGKTGTQAEQERNMDKPVSDAEVLALRDRALRDDPDTVGESALDKLERGGPINGG